jgi:hypothetical protein
MALPLNLTAVGADVPTERQTKVAAAYAPHESSPVAGEAVRVVLQRTAEKLDLPQNVGERGFVALGVTRPFPIGALDPRQRRTVAPDVTPDRYTASRQRNASADGGRKRAGEHDQ